MAKQSVIQRQLKRERLVAKHAAKRAELKKVLADPKVADEAFYEAQRKLAKLPRNGSKVRLKNRCAISGRPRAYLRKFGLSRLTFRELALAGQIPGITKASW
jgi:small subunit ribosomal protein S14